MTCNLLLFNAGSASLYGYSRQPVYISQGQHHFPLKMTSEEQAQKFHTDDAIII